MDKPTLDDIFLRCVKIRQPEWHPNHYVTWNTKIGLFDWNTGETWGNATSMTTTYPMHDWQVYTPPAPKPQDCPFCGAEVQVEGLARYEACVACSNGDCHCYGPDRPTEAEAIEAWNRIQLKGTET